MNSQISPLVISFLLVMGCASSDPAGPELPASHEWDRMLGWPKPLGTAPTVEQVSQSNNRVLVRITNNSQEPLSYQGIERNQPQQFIGIMDLLLLCADCEDDKVWYEVRARLLPMERKDRLIPAEGVFNAVRNNHKS